MSAHFILNHTFKYIHATIYKYCRPIAYKIPCLGLDLNFNYSKGNQSLAVLVLDLG